VYVKSRKLEDCTRTSWLGSVNWEGIYRKNLTGTKRKFKAEVGIQILKKEKSELFKEKRRKH